MTTQISIDEFQEIIKRGVAVWNNWRKENPEITIDIQGINLQGANFRGANFRGINFRDADLNGINLKDADLQGSSFWGANLQNAILQNANLDDVDLFQTDLKNACLKDVTLRGVNLHNAKFEGVDFKGANLEGLDFHGGRLPCAELQRANLQNSILRRVRFQKANLREVNLQGANLQEAYLENANLQKADLRQADLEGANIDSADLRGANLQGAILENTSHNRTYVSSRDNLVSVILSNTDNYEGFVFGDEEEFRAEHAQQIRRAEQIFKDSKTTISFSLSDPFPPMKIGYVIILLTMLYESIRIALTSDFNSYHELLKKASRPDLYGIHDNKYSLKFSSISMGSIKGTMEGATSIGDIINQLLMLPENKRLKKIEFIERIAEFSENRRKTTMHEIKELAQLGESSFLTEKSREAIEKKIIDLLKELDNSEERVLICNKIVNHGIRNLSPVIAKYGGSNIEINERPLIDIKT